MTPGTIERRCESCGRSREVDESTGRCMTCGKLAGGLDTESSVGAVARFERRRAAPHSPSRAYRASGLSIRADGPLVPTVTYSIEAEPEPAEVAQLPDGTPYLIGTLDEPEVDDRFVYDTPTYKLTCANGCGGLAIVKTGERPPANCAFCGALYRVVVPG